MNPEDININNSTDNQTIIYSLEEKEKLIRREKNDIIQSIQQLSEEGQICLRKVNKLNYSLMVVHFL